MNDSGEVLWRDWDGKDFDVYLFDGANVIDLTKRYGANWQYTPAFNDVGDVVYYSQGGGLVLLQCQN